MNLSIVIPALNEASLIGDTLQALAPLRARGCEVIVVDGGSWDATVAIAQAGADRVLVAPRGRASQMNAGAAAARGEVLLFLHADTQLAADADRQIETGMARTGRRWGRFDVRLSGTHPLLRLVERMMNLRSRLSGIATGDQAMFVERRLFFEAGAFPNQPLMEDVELSKRLKRHGRPLCLAVPVITSSRRWEEGGIVRTIVLMWALRAAYALGVPAERLARRYR